MSTRDRDQRTLRPANTQPARLPPIPRHGADAQTDKALDAIREHLEVREGSRGNPWEKAVTERRLAQMGLVDASLAPGSSSPSIVTMGTATGTVMLRTPDGRYVSATLDTVAQALRQTKLYKDLQRRLDDVARFDDFDAKVRALILPELGQIAAERGADIRRIEQKLQTETESFAATVTEVTAAVQGAMAGVRQTAFATANETRATAGAITQVTARLDGFDGGAATVEEVMTAIADRTTGLAAEYYVKVSAGKAIASIGLAASEDPGGSTLSSIILQADALAIAPAYDYSQTGTPSATAAGETWYNTATDVSYRSTAAGTGSWVVFTPTIPFTFDTATGNATISGDLMVGGTVTAGSFKTSPASGTLATQRRIEITAYDYGADANSVIGYDDSNVERMRLSGPIGKLYLNCSSGLESAFTAISNSGLPTVSATNSGAGPAIKGTAGGSGYAIEGAGPGYVSGNFTVGGTITGNLSGNVTGNVSGSSGSCTGNAATATSATYANRSGEVYNSGNCSMYAGNAAYQLMLQAADGNPVVYDSGMSAIWSGQYGWVSDRRLKENILPTIRTGMDTVNAIRVVDYSWRPGTPRDDGGKTHTGVIAQELAEVIPTAVGDVGGTLMLDQGAIIPFLVKAVQELAAEVALLKARA
jgi:hypothetical protein